MQKDASPVPAQHTGIRKDIADQVEFDSPEAARAFFQTARKRLLDVNNWHTLCEGLTSVFSLRDAKGSLVGRSAQTGDYFQIDLPGPGNQAGKGYDWVRVETVEDRSDDGKELTLMRVRPAPNPLNRTEAPAHFLEDDATSTFLVRRRGAIVSAEVHGRNERANLRAEGLGDKVRNVVTLLGSWLGFSDLQWKALVKALLCEENTPQS